MTAAAEAKTRAVVVPPSSCDAPATLEGCASPKLTDELLVPVDELRSACAGDIGTGGEGGSCGGGGDGASVTTTSKVGCAVTVIGSEIERRELSVVVNPALATAVVTESRVMLGVATVLVAPVPAPLPLPELAPVLLAALLALLTLTSTCTVFVPVTRVTTTCSTGTFPSASATAAATGASSCGVCKRRPTAAKSVAQKDAGNSMAKITFSVYAPPGGSGGGDEGGGKGG